MENFLRLTEKDTDNVPPSGILTLPNEILIQILAYLPSLQLIRLCTMCRRIHSLILDIVHRKIEHILNGDEYYVEIICWVITQRSHLQCEYLKTWRVDEPHWPHRDQQVAVNGNNIGIKAEPQHISNFSTSSIGSLYSYFSFKEIPWYDYIILPHKLASTWFSLDENEPFTNFSIQTSLKKTGRHLGSSAVFDEEEILVSVKWEWLQDAERATSRCFSVENIDIRDTISNEEKSDLMCSRILWFGRKNVAGLKLRVRERKLKNEVAPVVMDAQDDPAIVYDVYYEALLIRTMHILMAWEQIWGG